MLADTLDDKVYFFLDGEQGPLRSLKRKIVWDHVLTGVDMC